MGGFPLVSLKSKEGRRGNKVSSERDTSTDPPAFLYFFVRGLMGISPSKLALGCFLVDAMCAEAKYCGIDRYVCEDAHSRSSRPGSAMSADGQVVT